jgi:hypothetical protein|tara:strand:- start:1519 stop:3717 length:2199 start_codon:yes stop_codon:yes gene_type:complete
MLRRALARVVVVAAISLLLIWLGSPYLTTRLLSRQVASVGWQVDRLSLQRPTALGWRWPLVRSSSIDERTAIAASNVQLRARATGLELKVERLTVDMASSEQRQDRYPVRWLSSYRRILPWLPASGQIDTLKLCLPECVSLQLIWRRQSDGLAVTARLRESSIDEIHLLADESGVDLEMFKAGSRPFFVTLRAGLEGDESMQLSAEMLLVRDDWFQALTGELPLPRGLDLDWRTLDIRYRGDLLLDRVDTPAMLLQKLRGTADLSWSGGWQWHGPAFSLLADAAHSATLSMDQDAAQIDLRPSYEATLRLSDLTALRVTTLGGFLCRYRYAPNSLACQGDEVAITGPLGIRDLYVELLVDQFQLAQLLNTTPSAAVDVDLLVADSERQWMNGRVRVDLADAEMTIVAEELVVAEVPLSRARLSYSTAARQGNLTTEYRGEVTPLNAWLPGNFSGSVDIELVAGWQGPLQGDWLRWPLSTELSMTADNLTAEVQDNHLSGGQLQLKLQGWPRLASPEPAHMSWANVDVGFAVADLATEFDVSADAGNGRIDVEGISLVAQALGGRISSDDFRFNLPAANGSLTIDLHELELLQILSLEDEEFHSEGKLIGTIPVRIVQGNVIVEHGTVATVAPGGLLQYNPSESVLKLAESSEQMSTVLTTLKNFHYDSLDAELNYAGDGLLRMDTALKGHNPDFEEGRQIHFNLTIEEDIIALLKSLQLSDRLTDQIEDRMQ